MEEHVEEKDTMDLSVSEQIAYYMDELSTKGDDDYFVLMDSNGEYVLVKPTMYNLKIKEITLEFPSEEWMTEDELLDKLKSKCKFTK